MIKKLLFTSALCLASTFAMNAQTTTVYSENFNGPVPAGWTVVDADGDGDNWGITNNSTHSRPGVSSGLNMLVSFSYDNDLGPLTPDNYIISSAIDLSSHAGKTIKLKWKVASQDPDWSDEIYSVYAATANTVADMLASTTVLSQASVSGILDLTSRELDISALGGQATVYFAFRHHNSTDNFAMLIDDVEITATATASTQDFANLGLSMYPNPVSDVLNISSNNGLAIQNITITDINGRTVKQATTSQINVSDLASGTYIVKVQADKGTATSKFIKK